MNNVLQNLLKLQALEFGETTAKNVAAQTAEFRGLIPPPILVHYDRLRVRGKKGVALVRNQVCAGCHMHVPIGQITVLMRGEDIQLCESCGRYLYLPNPAEAEAAAAASVEAAKPATKEVKAAAKAAAKEAAREAKAVAKAATKAAAKAAKAVAKATAKPRKRRALTPAA